MTCREFTDFIAAYLSGELSPDSRTLFEQHLGSCRACRNYLAGYEETVKLGKRAFDCEDAELPDDVPDDLVEAILSARRSSTE